MERPGAAHHRVERRAVMGCAAYSADPEVRPNGKHTGRVSSIIWWNDTVAATASPTLAAALMTVRLEHGDKPK